jgi:tetratricopeptide (TPR) repeat protein
MRRVHFLAVVLLVLSGCAVRSGTGLAARLAEADSLTAAGCYLCLEEAMRLYDEALAARPTPRVLRAAFRTSVLLGLREKELGFPAEPHLDRARRLASGLPADEEAELALRVAEAIHWDHAGLPKEAYESFVRTSQADGALRTEWHTRLAPRLDDPFFAYLEMSLVCAYSAFGERDARLGRLIERHARSVLLTYRAGVCSQREPATLLESVIATDPRYVEARFFLGRFLLARAAFGKTSRSAAMPHLTAAYAAWPTSPSVTFAMAGLYRALNRLPDALRYYDETLALAPGHREALVGRTIALSHLGKHLEGVASATRILDLGQWYIGDAYYWRAFNHLHLRNLEEARRDIEEAKQASPISSDTFTLAGMIFFDRRELEQAAVDLLRARDISGDNCTAIWYLGLVRSEQKDWSAARAAFEAAAPCYRAAADLIRMQLAQLRRTLDPGEELDDVERDYAMTIDENVASEARALFNVAYAHAQLGELAAALEFAQRAAGHGAMSARAEELIAAIRKALP